MRKSAAVTSASIMGVGLVAATGAPAQADPVSEPACSTVSEHVVTVGALDADWFMDCVPQYGVGKAEFTLTHAEPLPADLLPLDDSAVTTTFSADGPVAAGYFGVTGAPNGFTSLSQDSVDPLRYTGRAIVKVAGVEGITAAELPAGCNAPALSYQHAYRVDYVPTTVTFSQNASGRTWTTTVTITPDPVYLGLNFTPADPAAPDPNVTSGAFDVTAAQCVVYSDGVAAVGADEVDTEWHIAGAWALAGDNTLWPFVQPGPFWSGLGEFAIAPVVEPARLPDTGADARLPLLGGSILVALGAVLAFGRRRAA